MTNPEEAFDICAKRRAILEGSGHMLVLGGPGSGKTTIALLKARRSVLERLQPEQSVLFLSFSNAAIRRILESAGKVLTPEVASQIDIKTYHSFAWDILKSHGYRVTINDPYAGLEVLRRHASPERGVHSLQRCHKFLDRSVLDCATFRRRRLT